MLMLYYAGAEYIPSLIPSFIPDMLTALQKPNRDLGRPPGSLGSATGIAGRVTWRYITGNGNYR